MNQSPLENLREFLEPVFRPPEFVQAAALCLRDSRKGCEVLLVSSLRTRRWILPKGWPMKGRTLAGAALQEAWEEAGVVGTVEETSCGHYTYGKMRKGGLRLACRVEVFRVHVTHLARNYPEARRRKRQWMPLEAAAREVHEPELKALLQRL